MQDSIYTRWVDTKWELIGKSEDMLSELAADYFKTYGQTPCCPATLSEFHKKILSDYQYHLQDMSETPRKFLLKAGIVQYWNAHNTYYTNDNLTDAIAEEMIKESPNMVNNFEKYPEEYAIAKPQEKKAEVVEQEEEQPTAEEQAEPTKPAKNKKK